MGQVEQIVNELLAIDSYISTYTVKTAISLIDCQVTENFYDEICLYFSKTDLQKKDLYGVAI